MTGIRLCLLHFQGKFTMYLRSRCFTWRSTIHTLYWATRLSGRPSTKPLTGKILSTGCFTEEESLLLDPYILINHIIRRFLLNLIQWKPAVSSRLLVVRTLTGMGSWNVLKRINLWN